MVVFRMNEYELIMVKFFVFNLGVEIYGVDLSEFVLDDQFNEICDVFFWYQVLFFKDQKEILFVQYIVFGKWFGLLYVYFVVLMMEGFLEIFEIYVIKNLKVVNGEFWYFDVFCDEMFLLGMMLQIYIMLFCGGDIMFSDMYVVYEDLLQLMKEMLGSLFVLYSFEYIYKGCYSDCGQKDMDIKCLEVVYLVVCIYFEIGWKFLFVNWIFMIWILGLLDYESDVVL